MTVIQTRCGDSPESRHRSNEIATKTSFDEDRREVSGSNSRRNSLRSVHEHGILAPYIHDSSRGSYTPDLPQTSFDKSLIIVHDTRECMPMNAGEEGDFP
jgi:hypothetical protein